MAKISKSIRVEAPVEKVYEYLTKPESFLEIMPSMVEVSNAQAKPDGTHSFEWVYKMAGIHFSGHSDTVEVEPNEHVVVKNTGGIPSVFEYRYESADGATKLTVDVEYTVPGKVLGKLAAPILERINEHEAEAMMKNIKARLDEKAEAGKPADAQASPAHH